VSGSPVVASCQLEHGLMCEYLFAQFSLERTQQEGVAAE
jgi:hypothetical protein